MKKLKIATRGSKLALWQANFIGENIKKRYPKLEIEYKIIKTSGDKILDVPLAKIGGKGLFVKEIEEALIRGDADIAVHSMKDVPSILPDELEVGVIPEREEPVDVFLSEKYRNIDELPEGATIGTSSLRRQAQLKRLRNDLAIEVLRGNLDTRLKKLKNGMYDAIVVAKAGLKRLGLSAKYEFELVPPQFIPAVGQGALGIEYKKDNEHVKEIISFLDHYETKMCVIAERAYLFRLEGGCQVPIGAYAYINNKEIVLTGFVSDLEGKEFILRQKKGTLNDAHKIGLDLAEEILNLGGKKILDEVYLESK